MDMNIKKIRERSGLTQEEFAVKIGMNRKTLSSYETGQNEVPEPIQVLVKLVYNEYLKGKNVKITKKRK
jgi:DNA-binding transcriptional regulator YiaG